MLTKHTAYKYETPYMVPFVISQCFTNETLNIKCGRTKIRYNILRIKYNILRINPYKSDTKVDNY